MRWVAVGWLAMGLALVVACKSSARERSERAVAADTFWPEAPKATSTTGARTFRYNPQSFSRYELDASGGAPRGSQADLQFGLVLALRFGAGAAPNERSARIDHLSLDASGTGQKMKFTLDQDGLVVDDGKGAPRHLRRGDPGPIDVAAMTDKPFTTLVFTDDNKVENRAVADHPFAQIGAGDILDNTLVLFPDLPTRPVAPGYKWSMTRNTAIGGTGARVDVTYDFEYVGDGACPSGATSCAQLRLSAATKDKQVTSDGVTANVTFGFAGKVFIDNERGAPDESRVHMTVDLVAEGVALTVAGTYTLKPTP